VAGVAAGVAAERVDLGGRAEAGERRPVKESVDHRRGEEVARSRS